MENKLIAKATTTINASAEKVWDALINPATIRKYMFGTTVTSDFKVGSPITWKGEWKGKAYEDKGRILEAAPQKRLRYSHFSGMSGLPDKPENYHNVTVDLSSKGSQTLVTLSQDNNATEEVRQESQKNWEMMLSGLKKVLEA